MIIFLYKCKYCISIVNHFEFSIKWKFVVFALLSIVETFVRYVERDASNFGPWQNYKRDESSASPRGNRGGVLRISNSRREGRHARFRPIIQCGGN